MACTLLIIRFHFKPGAIYGEEDQSHYLSAVYIPLARLLRPRPRPPD